MKLGVSGVRRRTLPRGLKTSVRLEMRSAEGIRVSGVVVPAAWEGLITHSLPVGKVGFVLVAVPRAAADGKRVAAFDVQGTHGLV